MGHVISTQIFNYAELDVDTADFLRKKESNIRTSVEKMVEDVGAELKEAQEELCGKNQYDGLFEKWYKSMGFSKRTVYDYIAYSEVVRLVHERRISLTVDELPKKLVYAIGAKSSESTPAKAQAKTEVLDGSIATLKGYRERIAELEAHAKQATEKAEQAETARQIAERKAQHYEQVFGEQTIYDANTTRVTNGDAITYAVYEFQEDVRGLVEKYAHLTHFKSEFDGMIDEGRAEYLKAVETAKRFIGSIEHMLKTKDAIILEQ